MEIYRYSDRELLEAIRKDDEKAFAELFKRYWKKVHRLTYARLRCKEATQEIVQDLFITLWKKRSTLTIIHLPSYLHVAVKNSVLNYFTSQMVRRKYWGYYNEFIPAHDVITDNDIALNELMVALENGIERLPEKTKRVFKLNWFEGMSTTEISTTLRLSKKTIEYHILQSTKKLRIYLKDYILISLLLVKSLFDIFQELIC